MNEEKESKNLIKEDDREESVLLRIEWLDVLRGIGIILVVLGHVEKIEVMRNWLYSFHMPLFFFAAGYVYRKKSISRDVIRRISTVLVPYFSFGLVEIIYWYFIESRFRNSDKSLFDAIIGLFQGQEASLDFNVHLWFLPTFFLLVILFNIAMNHMNENVIYLMVIFVSIVYAICGEYIIELPWGINRIAKYILFYMMGSYLSSRLVVKNYVGNRWFAVGLFIVIIEAFGANIVGITGFMWFLNAFLAIIGIILISVNIKSHVLEYIGRASIVILCCHGPIYRIYVKILSLILHNDTDYFRSIMGYVLIIVFFTIISCLCIYKLVLKYVPGVIGRH